MIFKFPSKLQSLVEKLPGWFKSKWSTKVQKLQQAQGHHAFPWFLDFINEVMLTEWTFPRFHNCWMVIATREVLLMCQPLHTVKENKALSVMAHLLYWSSRLPPTRRMLQLQRSQREFPKPPTTSNNQPSATTPKQRFCPYHRTKSRDFHGCQKFRELNFEER